MASVILALEYGVEPQDSDSLKNLIIGIIKIDYLNHRPLSKGMLRREQMVTNLPNIRLLRCHSSHLFQKVFPLRKKILDKIKKTVILMQGMVY